jgi:hypothetical protein
MKFLPIANDLNPYLLFLYLFQRAQGSTSVVAPVQTCSKVTKLAPYLFLIVNDLNPYLLFLYFFQRAKGSTSNVALVQTCSKVTNLTPFVVWTSLGPLPRWVPGPTTRWAPGTTRLALHGS